MVSILKDIPIDGVKIVPCRSAGDAIISAGEHLMVSPTDLSSDPEAAHASVKRFIEMNLDSERLSVGYGDDGYIGAKENLPRIFAGPRP
jgi:hypothetical protein